MRYFTDVLTNSKDAKEVRLFGLGRFFRSSFLQMFAAFADARSQVRNSRLRWSICSSGLAGVGVVASYIWTVLQTASGRVSLGSMAMYLGTIGQIQHSILFCMFLLSEGYKLTLFVQELFDFLEIEPAIQNPAKGTARRVPMPLSQGIEFCNVSFNYPALSFSS